jgi:hypothetical protein
MATRNTRPADTEAGPDMTEASISPGEDSPERVPDGTVTSVDVSTALFGDLLGDVVRKIVVWMPPADGPARIAGLVKQRFAIPSEYGDMEVTVLDVNPADPTLPLVRVAWLGTVLDTAVKRHDPQRGDRVALARIGKVDTGRPRRDGAPGTETYDDWNVAVAKGVV